jgi:hypothetical protein
MIYTNTPIKNHSWERHFSNVDTYTEFDWHQDEFTRDIKIIDVGDWYIQIDDNIPEKCIVGASYTIEKNVWHRLIGITGSLTISIHEFSY